MKRILTLAAVMAAAALCPAKLSAWSVPTETLHYSVNYHWGFIDANAGIATITTSTIPGSDHFRATLTGKSIDLLGHYYEVGDTMVGTIMTQNLQPVYTEHLSHESGEFSIETITYDTSGSSSEGNIVKTLPDGKVLRSKVSHYGGGLTLDLLAVFYYIRQLDYEKMQPGQEVTVNIFSGKTPETLTVTYVGHQDIHIDDNPSTPVYVASMKFTGANGAESDRMEVYISTEDSRIPLLVKASLKVGRLECRYLVTEP